MRVRVEKMESWAVTSPNKSLLDQIYKTLNGKDKQENKTPIDHPSNERTTGTKTRI